MAILVASLSHAQINRDIQVGVHGGLHLTDATVRGLSIPGLDILSPRAAVGYQGGVHAIVPFAQNLSAVSELNYAQRGSTIKEGTSFNVFGVDVPLGVSATSRINYLEVPLKLRYDFGGENGGLSGFVNAGPMVSYALSGKVQTRLNTFLEIPLKTFDLDMGGKWANRWQASAVVGAGVSIPAGNGSITLEGQYIHGLSDVFTTPLVDLGLRQNSYGFRIGYSVPIGGKKRVDKV